LETFLEVPFPNTGTLRVKTSIYEFREHSIQSIISLDLRHVGDGNEVFPIMEEAVGV
jgi:hypothetical protein